MILFWWSDCNDLDHYRKFTGRFDMKTYMVLFFTFIFLLSGCSILNREPDVVIGELGTVTLLPDGSAGIITCSERCEVKSQCGTADDSKVIMGGLHDPLVDHWDMLFADETAVTINISQNRTVQKVSDQSQENLFFYKVTANDDSGKTGWIAGWCVASTTQPEPVAE